MTPPLRREDILAGDGTRLALYRIGEAGATPVLLVAGTFSNHTFWLGWHLRGEWRGDDGIDYLAALSRLCVPLLAVSGAGDTTYAPPAACRALAELTGATDRTYVLAGRSTGFSADFDHPGIVVSRAARREVWPLVIDWLRARDPARRGGLPGA